MSKRHPTQANSESRRRQLDRLKLERRARRQANAGYRKPRPEEKSEITFRQLIEEIRRIAMAAVMPSQERFDFCKQATWPTAEEFCELFQVSWDELAREAGLQLYRASNDWGR